MIFGALCLCLAVLFNNRSIVVGSFISLLIVGKYLKKRSQYFFCGSLVLILLTFAVKADSSWGRLLIYKVSVNMFKDNWLSGVGANGFSSQYLNYQEAYFHNQSYSTRELLLADNTYYAFNDYWEFIISFGLPAILLLWAAFYSGYKIFRSFLSINTGLCPKIAAFVFLSISVAAFFNHIFDSLVWRAIWCITLFSLLDNFQKRSRYSFYFLLFLALELPLWVFKVQSDYEHKAIQIAKTLEDAGFLSEADSQYKTLESNLAFKQVSLKIAYGQYLYRVGQYQHALTQVNDALSQYPNSDLIMLLAKINERLNLPLAAEKLYLRAIDMVPNRFLPRYELFKLYLRTSQTEKAMQIGKDALQLPVKVRTSMVHSIRLDIAKELDLHNCK